MAKETNEPWKKKKKQKFTKRKKGICDDATKELSSIYQTTNQ